MTEPDAINLAARQGVQESDYAEHWRHATERQERIVVLEQENATLRTALIAIRDEGGLGWDDSKAAAYDRIQEIARAALAAVPGAAEE